MADSAGLAALPRAAASPQPQGHAGQSHTGDMRNNNDSDRAMLAGMHAIAQPLTALEARLYLLQASVEELPDSQGLRAELNRAVVELDQACSLFRLLQALLQVESVPARVAPTPLSKLFDGLEGQAEAVFAGSGISIAVRTIGPDARVPWERNRLPEVELELPRARQALLHGFSLAREMGHGQTRLLCDLHVDDSFVELQLSFASAVEGLEAGLSSPNDSSNLPDLSLLLLASMRAGLAGQGATVHFKPRPFLISILFSLASVERTSRSAENRAN